MLQKGKNINLYDYKPQNPWKYHLHSAYLKGPRNLNFMLGTAKGPKCVIQIKPTPKGPKYKKKLYGAWLKLSKLGHTSDTGLKLT